MHFSWLFADSFHDIVPVSLPDIRRFLPSFCAISFSWLMLDGLIFCAGDTWTMMWPVLFGEPHNYQRTVTDEVLFPGSKLNP